MTYEEFELKFPQKDFGRAHVRRMWNRVNPDSYLTGEQASIEDAGTWEVFLEHSCDEWVIGSEADARQLASDILLAADFIKNNP